MICILGVFAEDLTPSTVRHWFDWAEKADRKRKKAYDEAASAKAERGGKLKPGPKKHELPVGQFQEWRGMKVRSYRDIFESTSC